MIDDPKTVNAFATPGGFLYVYTGLLMEAHSRDDESEADQFGAKYSSMAGYDRHGLTTFFGKLLAKQGRTPTPMKWLSDHLASEDRVNQVNDYFAKNDLHGADLGAERFQ